MHRALRRPGRAGGVEERATGRSRSRQHARTGSRAWRAAHGCRATPAGASACTPASGTTTTCSSSGSSIFAEPQGRNRSCTIATRASRGLADHLLEVEALGSRCSPAPPPRLPRPRRASRSQVLHRRVEHRRDAVARSQTPSYPCRSAAARCVSSRWRGKLSRSARACRRARAGRRSARPDHRRSTR